MCVCVCVCVCVKYKNHVLLGRNRVFDTLDGRAMYIIIKMYYLYMYVCLYLPFFSGGFSLRGSYSKFPDRPSANQNGPSHRIPDLVKIQDKIIHFTQIRLHFLL